MPKASNDNLTFSIPMLQASCTEFQVLLNISVKNPNFSPNPGNQPSKIVIKAFKELLKAICNPSNIPLNILNTLSHTPCQFPSKASANRSNKSAIAWNAAPHIVVKFSQAVVSIVCIPPKSVSQAFLIFAHRVLIFSFIASNILPKSSKILSQASLKPAKLVFHATTAATITAVIIPIGPVNKLTAEPKPPIAEIAVLTPLLSKLNPFTIPPTPIVSLPAIVKTGPIAAAINPNVSITFCVPSPKLLKLLNISVAFTTIFVNAGISISPIAIPAPSKADLN